MCIVLFDFLSDFWNSLRILIHPFTDHMRSIFYSDFLTLCMPDSIHDDMIDSGWYDCIEFWGEEKEIPLKILQHVFYVILPPTLMHTNEL